MTKKCQHFLDIGWLTENILHRLVPIVELTTNEYDLELVLECWPIESGGLRLERKGGGCR